MEGEQASHKALLHNYLLDRDWKAVQTILTSYDDKDDCKLN